MRKATTEKSKDIRCLIFMLCIALLFPVSGWAQSDQALSSSPLIFSESNMISLSIPQSRSENNWALLDADGKNIRQGTLSETDNNLYLANLAPGPYRLFWNWADKNPPNKKTATSSSKGLLVLAKKFGPPEDAYFSIGQSGMALDAWRSENNRINYQTTLQTLQTLGVHRLATEFDHRLALADDGTWNWTGYDQLMADSESHGLRFIAQLDSAQGDDAEFARALLRQYGFKLDMFTLSRQTIQGQTQADAMDIINTHSPVFSMLKKRSAYAMVGLGGLRLPRSDLKFIALDPFLETLLGPQGAGKSFNLLDLQVQNNHADARRSHLILEEFIDRTSSSKLPRAAYGRDISAGNDSLKAQRYQAAELVKMLVFFRHKKYQHFNYAPLIDPDSEHPTGLIRSVTHDPRLALAAWANTMAQLSTTKPIRRLGFTRDHIEIYTFALGNKTWIVAWIPQGRKNKTQIATFHWAGDPQQITRDIFGKDISAETKTRIEQYRQSDNVAPPKPDEHQILIDKEPIFVEIATHVENIDW